MLIAFISDVHGNLPALEAAVADAEKRGVDRIVCPGDLTGYGPFPEEVCRFMIGRNIPALMGNYDKKVCDVIKKGKSAIKVAKRKKREILLWTVGHISAETKSYLASLPRQIELKLADKQKLLCVHGSPNSADDAIYPSMTAYGLSVKLGDARPAVLVCGHTHIPFAKHINGILVVNCGSAGHPIDGDPRPSYAIVQFEAGKEPHGNIIRFDYDRDRTLSALKKTSLPKELRKDFMEGNKRRFTE
ncbi:MAG: metallophosphoesterase family protein [Deltaproteobacteria bacterium]|nr:metallophosphoesterase family protein [Deltaproteobacteria bacterium]